jgi:hypothetical protein
VLYQVFLDSVAEDIGETLDLSSLLFSDDGHVVVAREDGSLPAGEAVDLAGELGLEIAHEARDLPGILDHGEEVKMRRKCGDSTKGEVMVSLASTEGTEDDVVERRPGPKKESALDGAAGDEDEGTGFGEVSEFSGHTL